ncbi:hypothetical protein ACEPAH_6323 [Sanghuangporus vaninii]
MASYFDGMPRTADSDDVFTSGVQSAGLDSVAVDLDDASSTSTTANMRAILQSLLDSKEKQLQQAGTLGQRVLAQQMELEERVRQLQEMQSAGDDHDEPSAELRFCYRELANTVKAWNDENAKLSSAFGNKQRENDVPPSPVLPLPDVPQETSAHIPSVPSASQSRRAKNAAHRANDVEFAFEIGSSLLTEVRRLQSLLGERDKAIQNMKEEKDDLEKAVESLRTTLREQEQNADKFKEENWNLEVSLQEMRSQLADIQAAAQRSEAEMKRLTKSLATARELNDSSKNEVDRLQRTIEEAKNKHEMDVALHRKQAAALAREKSDLQQTVDTYKVELARASRRLPRYGSPLTSDGQGDAQTPGPPEDEDDPFGPGTTGMGMSTNRRRLDTSGLFPSDAFGPDFVDASPDPSPSRPFLSPNHPSNEIEALQQKLAHAQRQINTLKSSLNREKELRMEYKRKLVEAGVQGQRLDDEEEEEGEGEMEEVGTDVRQSKLKPLQTPFRGRGRGRGRLHVVPRTGGRTLAQKLMAAQNHPDEDSEEEVVEDESEQYTSTAIPDTTADERAIDTSTTSINNPSPSVSVFHKSPSPEPLSNRTSVTSIDGMDPEFANVLRRAPSLTSASRKASPFTRSRGGADRTITGRRRGGMAFQQPRPSSLVGAPEALAAELGLGNTSVGMESVKEDDGEPERELREFACQTEIEVSTLTPVSQSLVSSQCKTAEVSVQENAPSGPLVEATKLETADVAIQVESELALEVIIPQTVDMAVQSDPTALIVPSVPVPIPKSDSSTQTIEPARSNVSVTTDHESAATCDVIIQTEPTARDASVRLYAFDQPKRHEAETQTTPRAETFPSNLHTLSNLPSSPLAQRRLRYLSSASTVIAAPARVLRAVQDEEEEDEQTDLAYTSAREPETETDVEEYRDARSSAPTPTMSESINDEDFHSMSTMTDNEFSGDDDTEDTDSIKASVLNLGERVARIVTPRVESARTTPKLTYESTAVSTELLEEEPRKELKRELSEVSIQTDEWQPATLPPVTAQVPTGFGLYRVGPSSQQFQFVSTAASVPGLPASGSTTPLTSTPPVQALRDATNTVTARPLRFPSPSLPVNADKPVVLDVAPTSDSGQRQHTQSLTAASPVDRSRPPTMMLPPPPKVPPPPNSMPPPSFIPEKRRPSSALSFHRDMPPPRPSSPPPPELIHRATTPVGSVLNVPGRGVVNGRQHVSSSVLRQPTSMSSVRSATNPTAHGQMSSASSNAPFVERRLQSAASLLSDQEDVVSRRSSLSSDFHHNRALSDEHAGATVLNTPGPASRMAATTSTDPTIIHAITQTMIGEFLYKYTRRAIGKGHGERRHKRFFWVHPYTKTLYWSSGDPGSTNVTEQSAKSAYIDSVRAVLDPNPMPPGLYQYSIVVSTPQREMKFTAPTKERHEIWLNALNFLLARPTPAPQSPTATQVHGPPVTPVRNPNDKTASPMSHRTGRTEESGIPNESPWSMTNITPRGARRSRSRVSMAGSVGKRSNTPAAEYLRWTEGPGSPGSPRSHGFELSQDTEVDDGELDFEIHDSITSDREGYEGLENVRACCDGRHTVGRDPGSYEHLHDLDNRSQDPVQKHIHIHHPIPQFARHESAPEHSSRPSSPAFSFRSRTSSRRSGEGAGNLFSRFTTRRSKTPAVSQEA